MKSKLKIFGLRLLIFLLSQIFPCVYLFVFLGVLYKINIITGFAWISLSCFGSFILAIVSIIYGIYKRRKNKKTKIDNWLEMNYHRLLLYYTVSFICFVSLKKDMIFSIEELRNLISLEWTMFGITIALFLVWHVLIVEYLKKRKPSKPTQLTPLDKWKYIEEKGEFYKKANIFFTSSSTLSINLFVLIGATLCSYILWSEINLINQNLVVIAFYFTTTVMVDIFLDILHPLREERRQLLKNTKVTNEEVDMQNQIEIKTTKLLTALDVIDESTVIDEKKKNELKKKLLAEYLGTENSIQAMEKDTRKEVSNDQL